MFLCLLVFQVRARIHIFTAVISGIAATCLSLEIQGNSYVIYASLLGATAGFALLRFKEKAAKAGRVRK